MQQRPPKNSQPRSKIPPEAQGLILLTGCMLVLLSLLSFHQEGLHTNWLGLLGHSIAWTLTYLFGLSSYLLLGYCFWIGWRLLSNQPIVHWGLRSLYFGILLCSSCILLNLYTEVDPRLGFWLRHTIHVERTTFQHPVAYHFVRYNLGGVPFYYLFADLPMVNLTHLLSRVGTAIVFSLLFIVSSILVTDTNGFHLFQRLILIIVGKKEEKPSGPSFWAKLQGFFRKRPSLLKTPAPTPSFQPGPLLQQPLLQHPMSQYPMSQYPGRSIHIVEPEKPKKMQALKTQLSSVATSQLTHSRYQLPKDSLLTPAPKFDYPGLEKELKQHAQKLEETFLNFGIEAKVGNIHCGPTITSFEVHPAVGVKVQKIKILEDDIALNMQASSMRIIAPIPGKAAVGIEIPSPKAREVNFKEMLLAYQQSGTRLGIPMLLGSTVNGDNVIQDLTKMPHLLIAGATGSGKSVCLNTIIMSILMNAHPEEIKLLLIDPKKVELTPYNQLPHMIAPVVINPQKACAALNWLVKEMERRYELLKRVGVRNITSFNQRPQKGTAPDEVAPGEVEGAVIPATLFSIVAVIDELADLMMVSSSDIETPIARIAQMARAVGIHLIVATQRPSREVITGLIKANFPARIAFKVASRINSQIILDDVGAETLLGNGDMLFLRPGTSSLLRAQGAYIRDEDINQVVAHICQQSPPHYLIQNFDHTDNSASNGEDEDPKNRDTLYEKAVEVVLQTGNASTTFLQRKLKIGYARAASLMDELEENGVVSPPDGSKPRQIIRENA